MNKSEIKARELYERNKRLIESGTITTASGLLVIAREQDALYKIIHGREDKKFFMDGK